ncbi:MAG: type II secretion system F family protein, partial [Bacilli bacterium]|nr:type II secretion system F family protein [Bacilli bacterium]
MDGVKLLQIMIILVILGVIFYLLRLSNTLKLEKRIAKFSISSVKDEELSLFEKLNCYIWKIIKGLVKLLNKSQVIGKYAEKYNKFIAFEDKNKKCGMDYIAMKFLLGVGIILLSLVTISFHQVELDFMFLLVIFLVSFFIPDIVLNVEFAKKRKKIEEDLLKAIIIMNSAFQSGRNIMQAIECVKTELDGPIQDEFKKIYLDITYGLSLDVVFSRFYERVKLEDARYIASSLTLLNKTGGDIVKVFSIIEKSIFDKKNLKNELKSLTASSQFVFKMLVCLPFIFALIIYVLNPTYFTPLFTNAIGIIIFIPCLVNTGILKQIRRIYS